MKLIEIIIFSALGLISLVTMFSALVLIKKVKVLEERENKVPVYMIPETKSEVQASVETTVADDTVTFSSEKALTIDDKYAELDKTQKGYYDQIVNYASSVVGARRFKNVRYEEYKVGTSRLVRMLIKRGLVVCEFILPNNDFKNYVNENKLKIKSAPTVLKVTDEEAVKVAKDSIDIAIKAIEEQREYKRAQTRERRKQARINKQG